MDMVLAILNLEINMFRHFMTFLLPPDFELFLLEPNRPKRNWPELEPFGTEPNPPEAATAADFFQNVDPKKQSLEVA